MFLVDINLYLCYNLIDCEEVLCLLIKEKNGMIEVTRFKGSKVVINAELIESVEETPDTVITLTSGKKMVVEETVDQVVSLVVDYKRKIHSMNV